MATTISVNGEDGAALAKRSGIRLVQDVEQALVLQNQSQATRDGRHGTNAPQAVRGGPAGTLAVQLSESNLSQGAIQVETIEYRSMQHPPRITEVSIGKNLLLTAIGGEGESGHHGGDGQRGLDGVEGTGATTASDATNGTDGGRGGDAGQGSNGGNGGPGGSIHIVVLENNIHLLMAVSYAIRGGQGGVAGEHGEPGTGGQGGKGGQGWRWPEIVGYKFFCTKSCIKNDNYASSSALQSRTLTHLNASRTALVAQMGALTVSGNNLQNLIAQTAIKAQAIRQPRRDQGFCKCGGGSDTNTCTGCDMKPIKRTFQRAPGLDGKDGENGISITTPLIAGHPGDEGTVSIAVHRDDGSTQEYHLPWSLELMNFEVEDENGDGVFEPGEHAFIRRIEVRNTGGMPSSTCRIPVTFVGSSEWFEPVAAHEGGVDFLPTSIPSGQSASTEGSVKVRLKEGPYGKRKLPAVGILFSAKASVGIRADMPWLERRMPYFDLTKDINIGYPCSLGNVQYLSTVAQGATSTVHFEMQNLCNRPIGESEPQDSTRAVKVGMTIPADFGRFVVDEQEVEASLQTVPRTRPQDTVSMQQQFRISSKAKNDKRFPITIELYLERPIQDSISESIELVLIERHAINLQISKAYTWTQDAEILLITNPKTNERQSQAVQHFVKNSLGMKIDLCNVHQNGGLLGLPQDDTDSPYPIMTAYRNGTILVFDNKFEFFDARERTTSQLCDPHWLHELFTNGCSALFLYCEDGDAFKKIARSSVFPLSTKLEDIPSQIQSSHNFSCRDEFVTFILQEKQFGNVRTSFSALTMKPRKWYRFGKDRSDKQAKAFAKYLRRRLPNERFLVSFVAPEQRALVKGPMLTLDATSEQAQCAAGRLIVLVGAHSHQSIVSTESDANLGLPANSNAMRNHLDDQSKFNIVATLPFQRRLKLLWKNECLDKLINEAATFSMAREMFQEIRGFLDSAFIPRVSASKGDINAAQTFLATHLSCLAQIFNKIEDERSTQPPKAILEVLHWVFAFAASKKRVDDLIRVVMHHRPGTKALVSDLSSHLSALNFDPTTTTPSSLPDLLIQRIARLTKPRSTPSPEARYPPLTWYPVRDLARLWNGMLWSTTRSAGGRDWRMIWRSRRRSSAGC
ncbi:MAG: hypothetical protein Q9160_006490 [Pyrenula sp. 1 TL-2023]